MTAVRRIGRRNFLAGVGGTLAIPTLSSLLPRAARAQGAPQLRLVIMGTDHGGVWPEHMFPEHGAETVRMLYGATDNIAQHDIRWSPLQLTSGVGVARLSEVIQASAGRLTSRLVSKMNVLGGVDISTYVGHNRATFNGNYAANDQGRSLHELHMATLDQVTASQPGFNKSPVRERTLNFGIRFGVSSSLRHSASAARVNGSVQPVQGTGRPSVLWDRLFAGANEDPETSPVDVVYDHYRSLTRGAFGEARRLSSADRERLEAHMTLISELQRKIGATVSCDAVPEPDNGTNVERLRAAADLYVAALRCGASNVGVITAAGARISDQEGWTNWHEQVAHNGGGNRTSPSFNPEFQRINYFAHRRFFQEVFLRVVEGLDVEEDGGETFLDRSLILWGQESGDRTHNNFSIPIVTAGSAGGYFDTGRYLDYRNYGNDQLVRDDTPNRYPGILLNRVLANVLQGVGVERSTYHEEMRAVQPEHFANGTRGYGVRQYHESNFWRGLDLRREVWPEAHYEDGDEPLPGWVRGA